MTKPGKPDEAALQTWVVAAVKSGAIRGKHGRPFIASVPNQRGIKPKVQTLKRLVNEGMVPGFPDLIVFYNGHAACIELKSPARAGKPEKALSENQERTIGHLAEAQIGTLVSKDFDEVIAWVKDFLAEVDKKNN